VSFDPEAIRALRGGLTRQAFAHKVGVTALTVYRWELPATAAEARSPRGRVLDRLSAYARAQTESVSELRAPSGSADLVAHSHRAVPEIDRTEYERLLPVLDRITRGELRRAEAELLALLANSGRKSRAARTLATQALARVAVLARGDGRSALSILAPLLSELDSGALPQSVELAVHVTAALVFSAPDGRLFDAGKTTVHVSRAERLLDRHGSSEDRLLLSAAGFAVGFMLNDNQLCSRALARGSGTLSEQSPALLRAVALYLAGAEAVLGGQMAVGVRRFQELLEVTEGRELSLFASQALTHLAEIQLEEAAPPREVLALTQRARKLARDNRHSVTLQLFLLTCSEGEALLRLGCFAEARERLMEALEQADEIAWSPVFVSFSLVRLYLFVGDSRALRAHAEQLASYDHSLQRAFTISEAQCYRALADVMEGASPAQLLRAFDAAEQLAAHDQSWWFLTRNSMLLHLRIRVAHADLRHAQAALARAERVLDMFPSAWSGASLHNWKGCLLVRQGRVHEARQALEATLATFELAGLVPEAALVRVTLAELIASLDPEVGAGALKQSEAELARLGMAGARVLLPALPPHAATSATTPEAAPAQAPGNQTVARLVVPIQRLSLRGMTPLRIQRELMAVLAELLPGASLVLEELSPDGVAHEPAAGSSAARGVIESVELGDGSGRRLRISAQGELPTDARDILTTLTNVASLSLEVSALRGFADPRALGSSDDAPALPGFIAFAPATRALKRDVARLALSRSTVIISGESGTGKEVVARALHQLSARSAQPFVAVNCAAIPRELFEGQLFGYRRGAFTGATTDHAGMIRSARGGTLFLDEVGELPLDVQPKLLRFLENGEISPLGERRSVQVDVRVIAATHRDLEALVREGRFREDLFYRLQVVPLHVPALSERREDIIPLTQHFLRQQSQPDREPPILAPDAIAGLLAHNWPGNVRELRNVIERSLVFASTLSVLSAEHLRIHREQPV
jgi:tetratricopeptide (TPR) repeat protein